MLNVDTVLLSLNAIVFTFSTSLEESLLQSFFVPQLSATKMDAFIGPTVHEKLTDGGRPLLPEILSKSE